MITISLCEFGISIKSKQIVIQPIEAMYSYRMHVERGLRVARNREIGLI